MVFDGINGDMSFQKITSADNTQKGDKSSDLRNKLEVFPAKTKPTDDAVINQDGSVTVTTKWIEGAVTKERNVTFVYDKDGNKVIKSVKNTENLLYGIGQKTVEYVDKDGDGFADVKVTKDSMSGEPKEEAIKYPKLKDSDSRQRVERDMKLVSNGINISYGSDVGNVE